jgi:hypothetical protein
MENDFVQVVEFLDQGVKIALEAQEKTGKIPPFLSQYILLYTVSP